MHLNEFSIAICNFPLESIFNRIEKSYSLAIHTAICNNSTYCILLLLLLVFYR